MRPFVIAAAARVHLKFCMGFSLTSRAATVLNASVSDKLSLERSARMAMTQACH